MFSTKGCQVGDRSFVYGICKSRLAVSLERIKRKKFRVRLSVPFHAVVRLL